MKLVKFELVSGNEIMINPKSVESIVRYKMIRCILTQ